MLTYQVRDRLLVWQCHPSQRPRFPASGAVKFTMHPGGPFGAGPLSNRLLLAGVYVSLKPELNTGKYIRTQLQYMDPISVSSRTGPPSMQAEGSVITVTGSFGSQRELIDLIESIHFGLPVVLALKFQDAPVVASVTGNIADVDFVWAYTNYPVTTSVTTKQELEQDLLASWERLELIRPVQNKRLFAALHYFHVACRLAIVGFTAWEFMSEILLNLSKVLEVLFPGSEGQTINAARTGLEALGYSSDEINKWYIPAMLLRNQLDVGHVSLVTLSQRQLRPVHDYTNQAEDRFRDLLLRVISSIADGTLALTPYQDQPGQAERTIRRLAQYFPAS